jgi:hypothetical protein
VDEAKALHALGIGTVAVMPNDTDAYPADCFGNMQAFARQHGLTFPYVIDETQDVAPPTARCARPSSTPRTSCGATAGSMPPAPRWCRTPEADRRAPPSSP